MKENELEAIEDELIEINEILVKARDLSDIQDKRIGNLEAIVKTILSEFTSLSEALTNELGQKDG